MDLIYPLMNQLFKSFWQTPVFLALSQFPALQLSCISPDSLTNIQTTLLNITICFWHCKQELNNRWLCRVRDKQLGITPVYIAVIIYRQSFKQTASCSHRPVHSSFCQSLFLMSWQDKLLQADLSDFDSRSDPHYQHLKWIQNYLPVIWINDAMNITLNYISAIRNIFYQGPRAVMWDK